MQSEQARSISIPESRDPEPHPLVTPAPEPDAPVPAQGTDVAHNPHPAVVIDYVDGSFRMELHNVQTIADAIGERVLAAFYKCFVGVERIQTYEHLMLLNHRCNADRAKHPEADRQAFDRNLRVLVTLTHGIMYEMGEALQNLCNAQVVTRIENRALWAPLNEIRRDWYREEYAALVRNSFAHHLGDIDDFVRGIRHVNAPRVAVLNEFNRHRASGHYHEPHNALLRAHDVQLDRHREFVEQALAQHIDLPELLQPLFAEVLRVAGIPVHVTDRAREARGNDD